MRASTLLLEDSRKALGLDFLYVTSGDGKIIASSPRISTPSIRSDWPVVASALKGSPSIAIDIFANYELGRHRARPCGAGELELVPTPNAVPTDRDTETRGMVVHSASPVSLGGRQPAALVGGMLLNQNLVFIDTINDLVYRAASLPAGSQGTATLFLDDVRITTNVRLFEGRRALGTRVSSAVRSTVLDQGKTWLDSAFVVNDWYISAYEPIIDSYGKRVGMLYVGFLEAPFIKAKIYDPRDHPGYVPRHHGGDRADLPSLGARDLQAAGAHDGHDRKGRERRSRSAHRSSHGQ